MKLSVSSYSYAAYVNAGGASYEQLCDLARETGFEGIEFIDLDSPIFGCGGDTFALAERLRAYCERIGLEIVAYTVGANLLSDDMDAEMHRLKRRVDETEVLGARLMRHDACQAPRKLPRYHYTDAIAEMTPYIRELTEYARSKGIRTCTENHGRYFQDPERVEALIRAVDSDNYGWLVDVGNFMSVDADVERAVTLAAPYAFHVHFKDNIRKNGVEARPFGFRVTRSGNYLRSTVVGHGAVPVKQCLRILRDAGYDGYLTVEFEGWEDNLRGIESSYQCLRQFLREVDE
ncbi:MAG: sugar phosphate isomerase/epimerase family protein [Christensenellales bacterium]|jgi:sugar phosphate isomerase/epimerase